MSTAPRALGDTDTPSVPADAVEVGRVMGAWGIKGGIRVKPFAADPQALFSSKRWFLRPPEGPRPGAGAFPTLLRIATAKEHGDGVVATVHDMDDRNAAEALKGATVLIARSSFPTPDEGEFYWVDLIGLQVHNRAGTALGEVVGLIETGPHCVLRIQPADATAEEVLIPFVEAYVDGVDLGAKRIGVDWDFEPDADAA
ncbi:ribosome maturation factor RimM [Rubrivivax rivuli]|uniref:Ribosome maturation factor RimM n=1 Tax=Rubrivivax rivuli TaxID=1862385 RepID=A0A437RI22_9BURK|nr:ribosome maturation factor RimM [Rubrivivax rivuli]RVU46328.1 ribosome maturation factor RimM [Rubrivivax rivuli]